MTTTSPVTEATMQPACMSEAEFALWSDANVRLVNPTDRPCRDCPAWFAARMEAAGTCNGVPGGVGRGYKPAADYTIARRRAQWRASNARRLAAGGAA